MKSYKRVFALVLALVLALALAACGQDKTPAASNGTATKDTKPASTGDTVKVGFTAMNLTDPFQITVRDTVKKRCEEMGWEFQSGDGNSDNAKQINLCEDMINGGINYLVLCPVSQDGILPILELAKEKGVDLALVAGTGPKGRITLEDVEAYLTAPKANEPAAEVKTSPLAAKIAEELGVDVSKIQTDGRVMKADVLAAAGVCTAAPAAEAAPAISAGDNDEPPVKVNPLRRSIAANMANSWHTSPRVTYTFAVDVTEMKALRAKLKDSLKEQGIKLTYNHILMKVVAKALMEFPDVNASFADNMLTRHKHVNMGLAVAKGDGLIVPNVKNADSKSLAEIAKETEALIEATRSGKIDMKDMTGGTFTISSLGPYGVRSFSPIINQPELAILGVCDIVDTPIVCNGEIVIRPMMNLCLTADHRVVDGVMASKFMKRVVELLENLYLLLI